MLASDPTESPWRSNHWKIGIVRRPKASRRRVRSLDCAIRLEPTLGQRESKASFCQRFEKPLGAVREVKPPVLGGLSGGRARAADPPSTGVGAPAQPFHAAGSERVAQRGDVT